MSSKPALVNSKNLGVFLILCGVAGGILTLVIRFINRGEGGGYLVMSLMAAGLVVAGSILALTRALDHFAQPLVVDIEGDIRDDLEDLKARRFSPPMQMLTATGVLALVFIFLVLRLRKLAATWDGFPVIIPTLILIAVVTWVVTRSNWFKNQKMKTPRRIFLIPMVGLILSVLLGTGLTETFTPTGWNAAEATRTTQIDTGEPVDFSLDFDASFLELPDCDDDACEAIFLVIALVVLTLILVLGSAFIPHFWFLAGSVLLTVLLLITLHEIRLRPAAKAAQPVEKSSD